jgi:predicted metalloprotease with PDZ domain
MRTRTSTVTLCFALVCASAAIAAADNPLMGPIPPNKDLAYPGTLALDVDLRDVGQKIFKVHESIPVHPGPMVFFYPKWTPGEHGPTGTLDGVAGVKFTANGQPVAWRRDLREMYALHLVVPAGVDHLDLEFQMLSPPAGGGGNFGGSVSVTERLLDLEWNQVLFYPAGHYAHNITFEPTVHLPDGWKFATALRTETPDATTARFKPADLETLVDSPLIAGKNFRRIELSSAGTPPAYLNVVADRAEDLNASKVQIEHQQALIKEAFALFGARHYQHYDFLLTLSDSTGHFGLEHHQSSDDRLAADYFTDSDSYLAEAYLMPHEYVHSWNGKFRRPADLATVNFDVPMQADLLWVYEGLTNYLGEILSPRSGFWTAAQYRDYLAWLASSMNHVPGRTWRALQDTADEAQVSYNSGTGWQSWKRGTDFYDEGSLLWLDVDTKLRELSHDKKSIDDFTHAFHGMDDGKVAVIGYDFNDVAATLNKVQPFDWAAFLHTILDTNREEAPLEGITRGGWKLIYTDQPNDLLKAREKSLKYVDLTDSIGVQIDDDDRVGELTDVLWQGPAFNAGLAPGMKIIAVNGDKYSPDVLRDAIAAAKGNQKPIELLLQSQDVFVTLKVDYHGGLKYPHLERIEGSPDLIGEIVKAHS